jgi:hypothetical protein
MTGIVALESKAVPVSTPISHNEAAPGTEPNG